MRQPLFLLVLALPTLALTACSSSEDDGPSKADAIAAAKLGTTTEVLAASSYLEYINRLDNAAAAFGEFRSPLSQAKQNVVRKVLIEDFGCPEGGTLDYSDKNRDDYIEVSFDNCRDDDGSTLDGLLVLECLSGDFSSEDSCNNTEANFGSGSKSLKFSDGDGQQVDLLGTFQIQTSGDTTLTTQSLTIRVAPAFEDFEIIGVSSGLQRGLQPNENGLQADVSGSIGLAFEGDVLNCTSGTITFSTIEALQVSNEGVITDGQLRLSNQDNQIATVSFGTSGAVTVSVGGSTEIFTRSQYESACSTAR